MKNLKTILIIGVVAVLSYLVYTTVTDKKTSLSDKALSNFAVEDTSTVDKIHLSDTYGSDIVFVKNEQTWTMESGECVQQHLIIGFLETFKYISVKSPVGENAVDNINKSILVKHRKVEIFQNGELVKTWFIGNATADHYGTYMLLSDPEHGKSPEPFVMHLPNMFGSIGDRFSTDPKEYLCSQIFAYDPTQIKSVEIEIPEQMDKSFKIVQNENDFEIFNQGQTIDGFDTLKVRNYLLGFKKVHFTNYNRTLSQEGVDSLRNSPPTHILTVTDLNGETNRIKAYRKGLETKKYDFEGKLMVFDRDNLWVFTNEDKLTRCQYFVFDKLLKDVDYFRLEN
ncbi:MAG: hypothetical protein ACWA41_00240 [Putridiphycobacter sp.]